MYATDGEVHSEVITARLDRTDSLATQVELRLTAKHAPEGDFASTPVFRWNPGGRRAEYGVYEISKMCSYPRSRRWEDQTAIFPS